MLAVSVFLTACRPEGKTVVSAEDGIDSASLEIIADPADTLLDEPPAAADGLFDDFIYNFMSNRYFQYSRISFPLSRSVDGKQETVSADKWIFDALYAHVPLYAMVYASEAAVGCEKKLSLARVVVDKMDFNKNETVRYLFEKESGKWCLMKQEFYSSLASDGDDFWPFYKKFAADMSFQHAHIKNPFEFRTYDSDTFQEIDGVLDVEQWPDFRPELPAGGVVSINYNQHYAGSATRVVVLTSASAGLSCTLVFKRHKGNWRLTRLEDL